MLLFCVHGLSRSWYYGHEGEVVLSGMPFVFMCEGTHKGCSLRRKVSRASPGHCTHGPSDIGVRV